MMSEKNLVKQFISFQGDFYNALGLNSNLKYKKEINIGYGISDIFYYQISNSQVHYRKKFKVSKINNKNLIELLLKINNRKTVSLNHLYKYTEHLTDNNRKNIINYLLDNEFISKYKTNKIFLINKKYNLRLEKSIAIEAKLKNWKRALFQAYRYNFVSDFSFVVLPDKYANPAKKNKLLFKKYNVGLITLTDNQINIIYHPRKNPKKYRDKIMMSYTLENLIFQN